MNLVPASQGFMYGGSEGSKEDRCVLGSQGECSPSWINPTFSSLPEWLMKGRLLRAEECGRRRAGMLPDPALSATPRREIHTGTFLDEPFALSMHKPLWQTVIPSALLPCCHFLLPSPPQGMERIEGMGRYHMDASEPTGLWTGDVASNLCKLRIPSSHRKETTLFLSLPLLPLCPKAALQVPKARAAASVWLVRLPAN